MFQRKKENMKLLLDGMYMKGSKKKIFSSFIFTNKAENLFKSMMMVIYMEIKIFFPLRISKKYIHAAQYTYFLFLVGDEKKIRSSIR